MAPKSTQLIIILAGVLVAVLVASGLMLTLLPGNDVTEGTLPPPDEEAIPGAPALSSSFNTNVLTSAPYLSLDKQLVQDGQLPVAPPPTTGKANPFL